MVSKTTLRTLQHRGLKTSGGIAFFACYGTGSSDVPHYRALDIFLNGGKMTALINKVIYTAIYACISLSIFMSSKLICDN